MQGLVPPHELIGHSEQRTKGHFLCNPVNCKPRNAPPLASREKGANRERKNTTSCRFQLSLERHTRCKQTLCWQRMTYTPLARHPHLPKSVESRMNFLTQVEASEFDVYKPGRPRSLDTCAKRSLPVLHEALKDEVVAGELDWWLSWWY